MQFGQCVDLIAQEYSRANAPETRAHCYITEVNEVLNDRSLNSMSRIMTSACNSQNHSAIFNDVLSLKLGGNHNCNMSKFYSHSFKLNSPLVPNWGI